MRVGAAPGGHVKQRGYRVPPAPRPRPGLFSGIGRAFSHIGASAQHATRSASTPHRAPQAGTDVQSGHGYPRVSSPRISSAYRGPTGGRGGGGGHRLAGPSQQAIGSALSRVRAVEQFAGALSQAPRLWRQGANSNAFDINPLGAGGWTLGRTDMGLDANAPAGAPILAPNDSKVVGYNQDWFKGQPYELLQLTKGPNKGKYYYAAENISNLPPVGSFIPQGKPIARYAGPGTYPGGGTGIEIGYGSSTPGTTLARATTGYSEGQVTQAGQQFVHDFVQGGKRPGQVPAGSPKVARASAKFMTALGKKPPKALLAAAGHRQYGAPGGGGLQGVPSTLGKLFVAAGRKYHIDPAVLAGVAQVETSMGTNRSTSSAGAVGLMQFLPSTAQGLGVNPMNDQQAVFGAAKLLNSFGYQSNPLRAIGAYNGGPGNPQYGYANQVMRYAQQFRGQPGGAGSISAAAQSGGSGGSVPSGSMSSGSMSSGGGSVATSGGGGSVGSSPAAQAAMAALTGGLLGTAPSGGTGAQSQQQQLLADFLQSQGSGNPWEIGPKTSGAGGLNLFDAGVLPSASSSALPDLALQSLQSLAGNVRLTSPKRKKR